METGEEERDDTTALDNNKSNNETRARSCDVVWIIIVYIPFETIHDVSH